MSEQTEKRVSAFDLGVQLQRGSDGRWRGEALKPWRIYKGPNGGYLAAIILNAQIHELADPTRSPRAFNVHFVDRVVEGELLIDVKTERVGDGLSLPPPLACSKKAGCALLPTALSQSAKRASPTTRKACRRSSIQRFSPTPVPPELLPEFARNFDYRFALGNLPYSSSPNAILGGWMKPIEARPVDEVLLACYVDAMPPALFTRISAPVDAPTVDLTVHFLGEPSHEHEWVLCKFESPVGDNGVLIEDGSMWSRDGRLLARSRQLALFRTPEK